MRLEVPDGYNLDSLHLSICILYLQCVAYRRIPCFFYSLEGEREWAESSLQSSLKQAQHGLCFDVDGLCVDVYAQLLIAEGVEQESSGDTGQNG